MDQVENIVSNSNSIAACVFVAAGMCLPICCVETGVVYSPVSRSLYGNGCTRYIMFSPECKIPLSTTNDFPKCCFVCSYNYINHFAKEIGRACSTNRGEEECM
jgi:hypothetical protein